MKKKINVFDYAGDIMKALDKGVLITTKADGKVDSMTLGWGTLGIRLVPPCVYGLYQKEPLHKRAAGEESGVYRECSLWSV